MGCFEVLESGEGIQEEIAHRLQDAGALACGWSSPSPVSYTHLFLMTEEGVAAARDEIFPEQEAPAQEAAESCPVQALSLIHI